MGLPDCSCDWVQILKSCIIFSFRSKTIRSIERVKWRPKSFNLRISLGSRWERTPKNNGNLSKATKELIRKSDGIRKYNMNMIEETLKKRNQKEDEVIKVAETFYRKLYSSNDRQTEDPGMEIVSIEILCVNIKHKWNKQSTKKNDQGQTWKFRWLINWLNQGDRRLSIKQTHSTCYQMFVEYYYTKCLEKRYNNTNSQKKKTIKTWTTIFHLSFTKVLNNSGGRKLWKRWHFHLLAQLYTMNSV